MRCRSIVLQVRRATATALPLPHGLVQARLGGHLVLTKCRQLSHGGRRHCPLATVPHRMNLVSTVRAAAGKTDPNGLLCA